MDDPMLFLSKYAQDMGICLEEDIIREFMVYKDMLSEWNQHINLTAIDDEKGILLKHFLDSLLCFKTGIITPDCRLMDVGTGAGFPGLALKIACKSIKLYLLDSVRKKLAFIEAVVQRLNLSDVEILWDRVENIGRRSGYRESFDVVTARAVATMPVLVEYCLPLVKINGCAVLLKGPEIDSELSAAQKAIDILGGEVVDILNIKLPISAGERRIAVIEKIKSTPFNYPRKAGIPSKKPLI